MDNGIVLADFEDIMIRNFVLVNQMVTDFCCVLYSLVQTQNAANDDRVEEKG